MATAAFETLSFASAAAFRRWLHKNHSHSNGIWLRFAKKGSGEKSVTYAEALDEALCFGWIDGQRKPLDDKVWLQKFTPRRARSSWSKRNTNHVERLTQAGLMMPAGLAAVAAAKADGRWAAAYSAPRDATVPDDFLARLKRNKRAYAFFEALNKANLYAIAYRLQTARKPETRERRLAKILEMMGEGRKFHP